MHPSTESVRLEALVTTMSEQIIGITRTPGSWVQQEPHDLDLQQIEQQVLRLVKELGASLVAGLVSAHKGRVKLLQSAGLRAVANTGPIRH